MTIENTVDNSITLYLEMASYNQASKVNNLGISNFVRAVTDYRVKQGGKKEPKISYYRVSAILSNINSHFDLSFEPLPQELQANDSAQNYGCIRIRLKSEAFEGEDPYTDKKTPISVMLNMLQ